MIVRGLVDYLCLHALTSVCFCSVEIGCYITKHGQPSRSSGFIKWESKADSFAVRGNNVLLFSSQFIEVRDIMTARLVQVTEGTDIRLLHSYAPASPDETILVVQRGSKDDKDGLSQLVSELLETKEIVQATPSTATQSAVTPALWDEWDM
jgi:hypothetical protein